MHFKARVRVSILEVYQAVYGDFAETTQCGKAKDAVACRYLLDVVKTVSTFEAFFCIVVKIVFVSGGGEVHDICRLSVIRHSQARELRGSKEEVPFAQPSG